MEGLIFLRKKRLARKQAAVLFAYLTACFVAIAGTVFLLEKFGGTADRMIAVAGVIAAVLAEFLGIMVILGLMSKKISQIDKARPMLITLTACFAALALTVGVLEHFGGSADRMLATSQTISLILGEFVGIMAILFTMSSKMAQIKKGVAMLGSLTAMFVVLAATVGILEHFGGSADRLLATSQTIVLILGEFVGIIALLSLVSKISAGGLSLVGGLVAMGFLTLFFAALAGVVVILEQVGGKADRMLATSQVIVLILLEFVGLTALLDMCIVLYVHQITSQHRY